MITGAMGHIGTYIIKNITKIKKFKKIILVDNFSNNKHNFLYNFKYKKKFLFYYRDITKKNSLNNLPKIDYCLHLASITNAEESVNIKDKLYKNNLGCFDNVINYCKKNKIKLIHLSSTSVYGVSSELVDENSILKPQSPYAEVKLKEEKILKKNSKNLRYVTLRFGTIAGVSPNMRFHTAINKFCFNAAMNTGIPVWSTALNQYRPYLTLSDALNAINFIINKNIFDNGIYNILSQNLTVKDLLLKIKKFKKIKIKYTNSKIMNQLTYKVSSRKIEKLGLYLNSNFEKEIKQTLKLFG
jgi:nucleoside-diphosphate-sugar epimerase